MLSSASGMSCMIAIISWWNCVFDYNVVLYVVQTSLIIVLEER